MERSSFQNKPSLKILKPTPYATAETMFEWLSIPGRDSDRTTVKAVCTSSIEIDHQQFDYWYLLDHDTKERWVLRLPLAGVHRRIIRTTLRELYCKSRTEFFLQIASVGGVVHELNDIRQPVTKIQTRDRDRLYWVEREAKEDGRISISRVLLFKKSARS